MERALRSAAVLGLTGLAVLAPLTRIEAASPSRRVVVFLPPQWPAQTLDRWVASARRQAIELRVADESRPVEAGWEAVRLATTPPGEDFRRRLARFPVTVDGAGFVFDGRAYRSPTDAILLTDPDGRAEILLLGNSRDAVFRLARGIFRDAPPPAGNFRAVSGELTKEGRLTRSAGRLAIDRRTERDRIAERERFFAALTVERRPRTLWRFPASARGAFDKWRPVLERHLAAAGGDASLTVVLFPDPATKALYTGSSRAADLAWESGAGRVEIDASAPAEPDLVSPVLAAAAIGGAEPRLRGRGALAAAAGARAHGRWWGRDVASFASFLEAASVHPTVAEVLARGERDDVSPITTVGAAAAWLDAGFREGGATALSRLFSAADPEVSDTLERWRRISLSRAPAAPRRRPLPSRFLRGVSYAMSNSIEGSYASLRSRETLTRLSGMAVNSISVIPYAFAPTERSPELRFVHRSPRGETDEGTVRAISDARSFGMTAMVKPQIWLGGGAFVGTIAMESPADWAKWFGAYRRFAVHHAIVAEAAGAALFCVGTELSLTEDHEEEWRGVIRAVRLATGAPLVYATNWASGAARVRFWDSLDAIGVDFYDPLSADPDADDAALVAGARRAAAPLARLARSAGRPVVFAEAGYPAARAAWTTPHDEDSGRPLAPQDAARAVRAVFSALSDEPWWRGVYWWKAFSDGREAPARDRGFNFLGRPAGDAIATGFRRLAAGERAAR